MKTLCVHGAAFLLMASQILLAEEKPERNLSQQFALRPSVAVASKFFPTTTSPIPAQEMAERPEGTHSTFKAVALSALVPGAGQAYNKSWIKAAAFLAVEVGGWLANRRFDRQGDELTDQFEAFANAHWEATKYYDWLAQRSGCQPGDLACLKDYERNTFSHFLPDVKNQTYYENIGKYDQFNIGWDDANEGGTRDSANREAYDFMRADANDHYNSATLFASAVILNHVISALDAAWTTNRYNKKIARSSLGLIRSSDRRLHPALTLKVEW